MFEVIQIGAGEVDRFIEVKDDSGIILKVFDYSAATVMSIEESFQIKIGRKYEMKLELFGDLIKEEETKNFGKKIAFNILEKQTIGTVEFYRVNTADGNFFIRRENPLDEMIDSGIRYGWYIFTRIDVIQLDDKIHPELL